MNYTIKKYLNSDCKRVMNVWDKDKNIWLFNYDEPKHKIEATNYRIDGKEIVKITNKPKETPYLFDIIHKEEYKPYQNCIGFKKEIFADTRGKFSIYENANCEHYVIIHDNSEQFQIPALKEKIDFCVIDENYLVVRYDSGKIESTKISNYYYRIFENFYKIFNIKTHDELFANYHISNILFDSKFNAVAFHDKSNTYFIKDNSIVKIIENYVFSKIETVLSYGKENELYILEQKENSLEFLNETFKDCYSHKLVVNRFGQIIFEVDGQYLNDLETEYIVEDYFTLHNNGENKEIKNESVKYGKNFLTEWYIFYTKFENGYINIVNAKGENLLKYNDITDIRIYIGRKGQLFFVCARNELIYIYDENWNCISSKYVIYECWREKYSGLSETADELERSIYFNPEDDKFYFNIAHAKLKDGSSNTKKDWSDSIFNSRRKIEIC